MQATINERLKLLIDSLGMSARGFSNAIGSSDTNTRNYLDRGSKPGADYLEKILLRFETVNSTWLLTGQGEPFLDSTTPTPTVNATNQKILRSQVINQGKGKATINVGDTEQQLAAAQAEILNLRTEVEGLKSLVTAKNDIIASKDETINLLRGSYNRPN